MKKPTSNESNNPFWTESLPHDTDAEESLLSACLQSVEDAQTALDLLTCDDFYVEKNNRMFTSVGAVVANPALNKKGVLDFAELVSVMARNNIDNPANYVADLVSEVPLAANIEHTAGVIRQKAILRKTISVAYSGIRECMSCNGDAPEVIDRLQQNILGIESVESTGNEPVHVCNLLSSAIERFEAAALTDGMTGVTSGYVDIDQFTAGFQPSDMILLAARPGMGKTSLSLNIAQKAADSGTPVLFFSLEMGKDQLTTRLISGDTGINSRRLESGRLSAEDWVKVSESAAYLNDLPIYIDDTPNLHYSEFRRKLRIAYKKHGVRFAMIDYIGLMRGELSYNSRVEEVASASRAIKMTAKELNIPILVLSQLNRNLEARVDKHPILSDLRESGALEQDADVVMFIYRDEMYHKNSENKGMADVEIAKHRNGACGMALLAFDATTTSFKNLHRG